MKVKKSGKIPEPRYPSHRQFLDYKTLVGVAAIGLGAIAGLGSSNRTAGVPVRTCDKPVAEPQKAGTNSPHKQVAPNRLRGDIAVEPHAQSSNAHAVVPHQATNRQDCISYTIKKGDTLASLAGRFLGNSNSWQEIVKANPDIPPDSIKVGQVIAIPMATATNIIVSPRLKGVMPAQH